MHSAHDQSIIVDALLLTIVVAYLGIAFQFWTRRRFASGRATSALGQLVIIFVFCAVCGYLPRLVELPPPLVLSAHAVLAVAAWLYLCMGQVDRLSVAVDAADRGETNSCYQDALLDAETEACARLAEQAGSKVTAGIIRERLATRQKLEGRSQLQPTEAGAAGIEATQSAAS